MFFKGSNTAHFKLQISLLASMYVGYGAMMICRQMLTIVSPALLADTSLALTKTNLGDFAAFGTLGALTGKLIWGPLGDAIGGRLTFLLGIVLSAVFLMCFGLSSNVMSFTVFAFLFYCTKSAGWPGMTKLIGNWYHPKRYGRVWGVLSTSSRLSVVLSTFIFGGLLNFFSWRVVMFIAAGFAIVIAIICYKYLKEAPQSDEFLKDDEPSLSPSEKKEADIALKNRLEHPLQGTSFGQGMLAFCKSSRVWLVIAMMMILTCMMAFLDFVSLYLMEVYQLTPGQAAMSSTVFPIGSLSGLLLAVGIYDKLSKRGVRNLLAGAMIMSTLCVIGIYKIPDLGLSTLSAYYIALGFILLFGLCISPAYYLPMSIFSIEYGGPHSAKLVCIIDAFGFAASAVFAFVGGRIADSAFGWDGFMLMLVVLSVCGLLSVWGFLQGEYQASYE